MPKFELYYPVNPIHVNQGFGANGAYYQANGINIIGHNGVDLMAYVGQPIFAAHDGTAYYEVDDQGGHGVVVISNDQFDYKERQVNFKSIYWHMVNPVQFPQYVQPIPLNGTPKKVRRGDIIGYADTTGLATGPHLHLGLKPIVPGTPPTSGDVADVGVGNWVNVEQTNGYLGAIDPTPYFNGKFADTPNPTDTIAQADQVVKAIDDLKTVETPANKPLLDDLIETLWEKFMSLFE